MLSLNRMIGVALLVTVAAGTTWADLPPATFDNLPLAAQGYWNGSGNWDGTYPATPAESPKAYVDSFTSGGMSFNNRFAAWTYGEEEPYFNYTDWSGWAYSNRTDNSAGGWGRQYDVVTGAAYSGGNFALAYYGYGGATPTITLNQPGVLGTAHFTNTSYAYYAMLNGDAFFGVPAMAADGWFKVVATGKDAEGDMAGTCEIYLADCRSSDPDDWYIIDTWKAFDMSVLGVVKTVEFEVYGSHWGYPTYFAMDSVAPEPGSVALLALGGAAALLRRRRRAVKRPPAHSGPIAAKRNAAAWPAVAAALVTAAILAAPASAADPTWADVLCSYEAGKNPVAGYTNGNAIFVAAGAEDDTNGIVSLGMWSKSDLRGEPVGLIAGFSTSIRNGDGADLKIVGNAFNGWYEPGYVEVACETSGTVATANGWRDETWYLLKPSNYALVGDPRLGPLVINFSQDNFDDGLNPYTDAAWANPAALSGYADVTPGGDLFDLDWAVDAAGNPVKLSDIAYVRVRTATDNLAGAMGYFSTELDYIRQLNGLAPEPASLAVLALGGLTMLRRKVRIAK